MRTLRMLCVGLTVLGLLPSAGRAAGRRERRKAASSFTGKLNDPSGDLRREISCLNLINALNLTAEQMSRIMALIERLNQIQDSYASRADACKRQAEPVLKELKTVLERQQEIPEELEHKVHRADQQFRRVHAELKTQLARTAQEIDGILTEGQLQVIADFEPCTLPPRDLSDPVRAGQASQSGRGEELLRRVREMPDNEFCRAAPRIVERGIHFASEHHGKLTGAEKTTERKRLMAVVYKARQMSDTEFEMNKSKLGEEFAPRNKVKDLQSKIEEARTGVRSSKAVRFLLSPAGVSVLQKRAKQMKVAMGK